MSARLAALHATYAQHTPAVAAARAAALQAEIERIRREIINRKHTR